MCPLYSLIWQKLALLIKNTSTFSKKFTKPTNLGTILCPHVPNSLLTFGAALGSFNIYVLVIL